ncbi:MAG: hypothetical protein BWK76_22400 [Desulfobulbaceae bacterium A2]|nr:MAG: hypothetical protein BWK76_22400 [Desulfobulbaceae bacterium A2]
MSHRVRFDEIPPQGLRLELAFGDQHLGLEQRQLAPLTAQLVLSRQAGGRVLLQGHMSLTVELICDRCLATYAQPVDEDLVLLLELRTQVFAADETWEHATAETPETMLLEAPVVDIDDILRQQVCLSLPFKHLCREDCPGLCPGCGALRGSSECRCGAPGPESPFARLRGMKRE